MTWFDYAVIGIIGVSIVFSVIHGLARELLSLASWIVAFLVAELYATDVAPMLSGVIAQPALRLLAGFLSVFLVVLVTMSLLAMAVSRLIKGAGLGFADRALGAVFGLVRGLAIVLLAVLLAGLTALPRQPEWQHAMMSAPLVTLANLVKVWLPSDLAKHINYG
jgi:membrane protein required for colicin V production